MDSAIARLPYLVDADLHLCETRGVAYQGDMAAGRVHYDDAYFDKVSGYEGTPVALAVNEGRVAMLKRRLRPGASVLDYGAGSGAFVAAAQAAGFSALGFDVMPKAAELLKARGCWCDTPQVFDAVTLWDCLEHLENPAEPLDAIGRGAHCFASVPIFDDLGAIRASKHYRPGEHLYYWTAAGFVWWMGEYGFRLIEASTHEIDAGRECIGAFAFRRDDCNNLTKGA